MRTVEMHPFKIHSNFACKVQLKKYIFVGLLACACLFAFVHTSMFQDAQRGAVSNEIGDVYFFQDTREMQFHINQTTHINNAQKLIGNINVLLDICNDTVSLNCAGFQSALIHNKAQLKRDIIYINSNRYRTTGESVKRIAKRSPAVLFAGLFLFELLSNALLARDSIRKKRDIAHNELTHLQEELNLLKNTVSVNQEALANNRLIFNKTQEKMRKFDNDLNKITNFYDTVHELTLTLEIHRDEMSKLEDFYTGHIREIFFRVVDESDVTSQLEIIRNSLTNGQILPQISVFRIIDLAKMYYCVQKIR